MKNGEAFILYFLRITIVMISKQNDFQSFLK